MSGATATVTMAFSPSRTLTVPFAASTSATTPRTTLKAPETTCSAVSFPPSALLLPSTRTWSPTASSPKVPGFASLNLTEVGA